MALRAGHALVLIVISLLFLGVVMVSSAGLSVGGDRPFLLRDVLLSRTACCAALAVVLLIVGSRVPLSVLSARHGLLSPVPWIAVISVALLVAVHVPGLGHEVNGARRWLHLGPVGFQPSEVAKWGLLFVLAGHGARRIGSMGHPVTGFFGPMLLVGLICALIATEDLGTAVLISAVSILVLVAAGAKVRYAAALLPLGLAGIVAAVLSNPYRIDRIRAFLDPYADPQGIGYHVLQSMAAVSGGGLAGRGLGNGLQKFGYLPEDTTDFLFAIITEELGIAGAALVVFLYVALLVTGFPIVAAARTPFDRLLGLGILLTIGLQALMNLLVVTGLAPTKGIALPLLSAGGTGWCLTAFCVGLLVSMDWAQAAAERADGGEVEIAANTRALAGSTLAVGRI